MRLNKQDRKVSRQLVLIFTVFAIVYFLHGVSFGYQVTSSTIKVAVIDTGYAYSDVWAKTDVPNVCGEFNFTKSPINDEHGHGTHIIGLIHKYAAGADYCVYSLKYVRSGTDLTENNLANSNKAFKRAIELKVDVINYSGGGTEFSSSECTLVTQALDAGILIVAAAGNQGKSLNKQMYFPAQCDPRVIIVESADLDGKTLLTSNYGLGTVKELGDKVLSICLKSYCIFTGTSQATAITTGKLIKSLQNNKN